MTRHHHRPAILNSALFAFAGRVEGQNLFNLKAFSPRRGESDASFTLDPGLQAPPFKQDG